MSGAGLPQPRSLNADALSLEVHGQIQDDAKRRVALNEMVQANDARYGAQLVILPTEKLPVPIGVTNIQHWTSAFKYVFANECWTYPEKVDAYVNETTRPSTAVLRTRPD